MKGSSKSEVHGNASVMAPSAGILDYFTWVDSEPEAPSTSSNSSSKKRPSIVKNNQNLQGGKKPFHIEHYGDIITACGLVTLVALILSITSLFLSKNNGNLITSELANENEQMQLHFSNQSGFIFEKIKKDRMQLFFKNCQELYDHGSEISGVYFIKLRDTLVKVYCDMDIDEKGWTVIQRRVDGDKSFDMTLMEYEGGFGNVNGDHWLGLNNIHLLTSDSKYMLRIDFEGFDGSRRYATYSTFSVGAEPNYHLSINGYKGTVQGDSMKAHNGMAFTTRDADRDEDLLSNCASDEKGGWWFKDCGQSSLNGKFYAAHVSQTDANGIVWNAWDGNHFSVRKVEMKIQTI